MRKVILAIKMICILSIVSGCSKRGPKAVLEKAEKATFVIYTYDEYGSPAGSGSGFFIDENGTGITNYHVLDKSMKAVIKLKDGAEYEIDEVIASDKRWDIVKFTIHNEMNLKFKYLEFSEEELEQGDKIYNLGAPLGLSQTFTDGLVSSLRTDSHGQVAQVSNPISQGSSGSPIMNEFGEVVAVATFKQSRGENLNFGVLINEERLSSMLENPFIRENRQFNNKEGFVILNLPSDQDNDLVLNALQFKTDATIAYLSYTNLDMTMNGSLIWCSTGKGDDGFYIEDLSDNRRFYIVSSSIGANREEGTSVPLATVCKFQINFPSVDKNIHNLTISEGGMPEWSFSNINLDNYRSSIKIDLDNYQKEYAYSTMQEGQLDQAQLIFEGLLDDDPENIQALNAMGIISYVIDNNKDAINYFSEVIDNHPNSKSGYLNRSYVYKYQGETEKAIRDITNAISIDSDNADLYMSRADLYIEEKNWAKAKNDIVKVLQFDNYDVDNDLSWAYYKKSYCELKLGEKSDAEKSLKYALRVSTSPEMKQIITATLERNFPQNYASYNQSGDHASSYFTGNIGPFPVTLFLKLNDNGNAEGWYYYDDRGTGNIFTLSGYYTYQGEIVLNEYTKNGNNTGRFEGKYDDGKFRGTFKALVYSKVYDFVLIENQ